MKKIIKKVKTVLKYLLILFDKFICIFLEYPEILDSDKTVKKIISDKMSISRFGDGEFQLIKNNKLKFQDSNELLAKRLLEVLQSNDENILIGIPKVFCEKDLEERTQKSKRFWTRYLIKNRIKIYKWIDKYKVYGDSLFTRPYITLKEKVNCKKKFEDIKEIWRNRDIIIVEGEFSRLGVGNNLFENANSIKRILAPAENAFQKYEEILKQVNKQDKKDLILIALGPTATILAYDLNKCGYQAIDIGHIDIEYEWFLRNTIEKVAINNKYTNEVDKNENVNKLSEITDEKYLNEIIVKVN